MYDSSLSRGRGMHRMCLFPARMSFQPGFPRRSPNQQSFRQHVPILILVHLRSGKVGSV